MRHNLYILTDPRAPLEIRYVGITSTSLEKRLYQHIKEAKGKTKSHRCNWIRKLISEGIQPKIELLDVLPTWEAACEAEIKSIATLLEFGYNLVNGTLGGEGSFGMKLSSETKQKISEAGKGNTYCLGRRLSEETKRKIGEANRGMKHSPETKQKIGMRTRGKNLSLEIKQKMSEAHKGKVFSPAHRAKMSEVRKGKKLSPEHRVKISEGGKGKRIKSILCTTTSQIFSSIKEAASTLKLNASHISRVCKGKLKQTGGYHFRYN